MKNIFLLLLITITGASCTKDTAPTPNPLPAKRVVNINSSPGDYQAFEYNSSGHVTKYIAQWANGTGTINKITHTMEYSGSQLFKATNDVGFTMYDYQNNLPVKADNFLFSGKKISTLLFYYTPEKRLDYVIEQIAFPVAGGAEETKVSYEYYANGNVSRIDFAYRLHVTGPFEISFSKVFVEYDNQKKPEADEVLGSYIGGIIIQKNNPLKINNLDKNGNVQGYSRYEYTYDAEGYPMQRKHFIAVGTIEQAPTIFQYTYQ